MSAKGGRKKKGASPAPLPGRVGLALLVARCWVGGFFLATAEWKLLGEGKSIRENVLDFRHGEYVSFIETAIQHPPTVFGRPLQAYARFLEGVMLPGGDVFAPAILFFEVLLGIGLVLGGGVRLLAGLGLLMMLAFDLAKPDPRWVEGEPVGVKLFSTLSANWPVTVLLFVLFLTAAGRFWGVDAWLRARAPRWLRWIG